MKKVHKKILSCILISSLLTVNASNVFTSALTLGTMVQSTIGSVIASTVPRILCDLKNLIVSAYENIDNYFEVNKYMGFKSSEKIINELEKIVENKSEIRIYGQDKAKKQAFEALCGIVTRIDNLKRESKDIKEIRGNIVYLIGPSGTGKTKMCYAIAEAFLKHPEKTTIFCHSESITGEAEVGTQLFKTITSKDIGKKRTKNIFTGSDGLIPKDEESPMLKHLLNWYEAVVIIDEYDKMKQKSAKPGSVMNINGISIPTGQAGSNEDKSADEILRSIASTGKYKFMNKEVDCSKVLFLITTNETREELEKNFGISGIQGGGFQRLNIAEFDYLSIEACREIVKDMIDEVTSVLVDKDGLFKLNSINFDSKSIELMSQYIFNDKVNQGRTKYKLEDKIYSLFSKDIGKEYNKDINLSFEYSSKENELRFVKETL